MTIIKNILYGTVILLIAIALYMTFIYAPVEATMGMVQKIFYFHVGAAFSGFLMFFLVFICSIMYLAKKKEIYDIISISTAEIGVLLITLVLLMGILWAKPVWNVWWTWDPRLTTTFVLWLIYVAYLVLRSNLKESKEMPTYAAVFGIIGFLDVPMVFMSIRWWRTVHPIVISRAAVSLEPAMLQTMIVTIIAMLALTMALLFYRIRLERLKRQLEYYKNSLEIPA